MVGQSFFLVNDGSLLGYNMLRWLVLIINKCYIIALNINPRKPNSISPNPRFKCNSLDLLASLIHNVLTSSPECIPAVISRIFILLDRLIQILLHLFVLADELRALLIQEL